MPKNCCVPHCTKKGYVEGGGGKISYFKFPQEKHLFDEWICAILRDVGRHFKVTDNTCVCSRHYPNLLAQAIHNYHSNHPVGRMDNLG